MGWRVALGPALFLGSEGLSGSGTGFCSWRSSDPDRLQEGLGCVPSKSRPPRWSQLLKGEMSEAQHHPVS